MRTITTEVFKYSELSDKAKERARDWYREAIAGDTLNDDFLFDDCEAIAALIGLEFHGRTVKLYGGGTKTEPAICYSLSYSQRDGASFAGTWRAEKFPKTKKGKPRACPVKDHALHDKKLARICRELSRVARECPDLALIVSDHHYYGMTYETQSEAWDAAIYPEQGDRDAARVAQFEQAAKDAKEAMRDFAAWIYNCVRAEYEYQTSDDVVAETIEANEYEFTIEGERI